MKRVYLIILTMGVISLICVGVFVFLQSGTPPAFQWDIEVGDTFQYEVRTWGNTIGGSLSESTVKEILGLNGTIISVTIAWLPSLERISDSTSFQENILHINKVNCSFINGTELAEAYETEITSAISGCILPAGSWSTIDSWFPQETPGYSPNEEYIATVTYENYFHIEWVWYGPIDDHGGWSGNVSITDGAPHHVIWHYYHQATIYIEFILVE